MEKLEYFYGFFNLFIGIVCTLIGFKIYRPFRKDKEEEMNKRFRTFYKVGGIALIIWGLIKVL
jgi:hypothetical protein